MKTSSITSALAFLALSASAAPTATIDYTPPGGWESIDWESIKYPVGTGAQPNTRNQVFDFTSTYSVVAKPDQVVNGTTPTGGLQGCTGYYNFGINSEMDFICYSIKLVGFRGEYESAARTSTHVHEAARGASGPPRLAFKNPTGKGNERYSYGCMKAPYTTGLLDDNGVDTGSGFSVAQIEANPSAFMADVHSSLAAPGAVRGQLS